MSGFQGNDNLRDKRNLNTKNGKVRPKKDIFMSEGICIKPIIS
jgi:hypothetical protein